MNTQKFDLGKRLIDDLYEYKPHGERDDWLRWRNVSLIVALRADFVLAKLGAYQ